MDEKGIQELKEKLSKAHTLTSKIASYKDAIDKMRWLEESSNDIALTLTVVGESDIHGAVPKGTININFDRSQMYEILKEEMNNALSKQLAVYEDELKSM